MDLPPGGRDNIYGCGGGGVAVAGLPVLGCVFEVGEVPGLLRARLRVDVGGEVLGRCGSAGEAALVICVVVIISIGNCGACLIEFLDLEGVFWIGRGGAFGVDFNTDIELYACDEVCSI